MSTRSLTIASVVLGTFVLVRFAPAQGLDAFAEERDAVPASAAPLVLEGFVLAPDGAPAEGATVVCSSGGTSVTDALGRYRLETWVPAGARVVELSAASGALAAATTRIDVASGQGFVSPDPLALVAGTCRQDWRPTFGEYPGSFEEVSAMAVYDDGSGPALYAAGSFTTKGGLATGIGKWDGSSWSALGSGTSGDVRALAVYDDGSGPALYAGGEFTGPASRIAKWNGSVWSPLGSGMNNAVFALTVYDDGSGPALYAGGFFSSAGGVPVNRIAKWDGSVWSALGSGVGGGVAALAVFDDGTGPALYVGGSFTSAGGVAANGIAKWNGSAWSALGGVDDAVGTLEVFDDGTGAALYVGGFFTSAGGVAANHIAKWNGSVWSALGTGVEDGVDSSVRALEVFDDGSGAALLVTGGFATAGGVDANGIAKWNGMAWSSPGSLLSRVWSVGHENGRALVAHDDGTGPALYVGGLFLTPGDVVTRNIVRWNGSTWSALPGHGVDGRVRALAVYDDGSGPALHAAGAFASAGGEFAPLLARWDGASWTPLVGPLELNPFSVPPFALALTVFDNGNGPALYVGGDFALPGVPSLNVAKWRGSGWTQVGSGGGMNQFVSTLAVYDDGGGPALYAGGGFSTAGGVPVNRIAKLTAPTWSPLGSGLNDAVLALSVYDEGSGPALFAGGGFTTAGGVAAIGVAKWDGASWSALGSGIDGGVAALTVYDDGGGAALYAGGAFSTAGGAPANRIARWDGTTWSPLGSGISGSFERVLALTVHDDGSGPALYVGGDFTSAGGVAARGIARWDGTSWSALGSGVSPGLNSLAGPVDALASFEGPDDHGPALYVGGNFWSALETGDSHLARWGCIPILQQERVRRR